MLKNLTAWDFWDKALSRALRTALQGFIAGLSGCAVIQDLNWSVLASVTVVAVLSSLATSIVAGLPEVE